MSLISAGSRLSVAANAISMPTPAISPSCATPEKLVGTKARNPAEVAAAATIICTPERCAVSTTESPSL